MNVKAISPDFDSAMLQSPKSIEVDIVPNPITSRGLLNDVALLNILFIFVTLDTSHPEILSLNVVLSLNNPFIFVTLDTFQLLMGPYSSSKSIIVTIPFGGEPHPPPPYFS